MKVFLLNTIIIKFNYFTKLNFYYLRNYSVKILPNHFETDRNERTNEPTNQRQRSNDIKKEINNAVLFHLKYFNMCSKFGYGLGYSSYSE